MINKSTLKVRDLANLFEPYDAFEVTFLDDVTKSYLDKTTMPKTLLNMGVLTDTWNCPMAGYYSICIYVDGRSDDL